MNESTEPTPVEVAAQVETDNNSVPELPDQTEIAPAQEVAVEEKQEPQQESEKPAKTESKDSKFKRCQRDLQLLHDLANNNGKITTDLISEDKAMQTYDVVGADDQGNLILQNDSDQDTISKKVLLADARISTAELINTNFDSLNSEEQAQLIDQAHEAGFIMDSDLETLIDSHDTEKIEKLKKLFSEPIVSADTLGEALELIEIPHSAASITKSIEDLNGDIDLLNLKIKKSAVEPNQIPLIKAKIQEIQNRVNALKRVNGELASKFANQNWSIEAAYQKVEQGEMSSQEFYNQYFEQFFKDSQIQELINQAQLSEEQKNELKNKVLNGLKIGGGILGVLMALLIMQGMGGGGGGQSG